MQHELAVLAQKLRNLHIYGCWWYCNNPSMIEGITKMRMEMLGTNFTAQHSDARVLEQLIYKWKHSREAISVAVMKQHKKLIQAGWRITKGEIYEEVRSLLGGSYAAFTARKKGTEIPNVGSSENLLSEVVGSRPAGPRSQWEGGNPGRPPSSSIQVRTSPRGYSSRDRDTASPRMYDSPRGAGGMHQSGSGSKDSISTSPRMGLDPSRFQHDNRISNQSPSQNGPISPNRRPRKNSSTNIESPMPVLPDSHANGSPMYTQNPSIKADMPMC
jgi:hypothetical protein